MQADLMPLKGETKEEYVKRMAETMEADKLSRRESLKSGETKVVMEVDDYGFLLPGHDELLMLKKSFPHLKITCFTVPMPKEFFTKENAKQFTWDKYRRWSEMVNSLDWLNVAVHGFAHTRNECETGYGDAVTQIKAVENLFDRIGLKHVKIWRAPYWEMSYDFALALRDRGWAIANNRNVPRPMPHDAKVYEFNWSFEEKIPSSEIICGHGHVGAGRSANNVRDQLGNILTQLPTETQFITLNEHIYGK